MRITKNQLKRIIKEAFPVKGKAVGNFIKKGRAGRTLTMQGREYLDLGKGHWEGPGGEKLNWVELSSMASALGDQMVMINNNPRISEAKITKKQLKRIIKEEKAKLLNEIDFVNYDLPQIRKQAYSKLEDLLMEFLPMMVDDLRAEEFATFEKVVADAMAEIKERVVKNYSGEIVK